MFRLSTILFFLALAVLSVIAIPTPTVGIPNPFTLRQITRADIVNKHHASPVRRQGPSAVPPRPFRIRVPTNSDAIDYAGLYFVNTNLDEVPAGITAARINAEAVTAPAATIYQLSTTGVLQASNDLTEVAVASGNPDLGGLQVLFVTSGAGPIFGLAELTRSVGNDLVLACNDAGLTARTVGLRPDDFETALVFSTSGVLPVVVEYI